MITKLSIMLMLILNITSVSASTGVDMYSEKPLEAIINHHFQGYSDRDKGKYIPKAMKLVPLIIGYSKQYNVDPLDMVCLASLESCFVNYFGKDGELGPFQVMPIKEMRKKFDMNTLEGQMEAGHYAWSLATKCKGKTEKIRYYRAHVKYASGSCRPRTITTSKKMKYRSGRCNWLKRKFRGAK